MIGRFQFAVQKAQPIAQPAQAYRAMMTPQAAAPDAAQIQGQPEQAIGVKTDDDQMTVGPQHALHFAQTAVGALIELQRMECDDHIHAVTFQRQFVAVTQHRGRAACTRQAVLRDILRGRAAGAGRGQDAVVNPAIRDKIARRQRP